MQVAAACVRGWALLGTALPDSVLHVRRADYLEELAAPLESPDAAVRIAAAEVRPHFDALMQHRRSLQFMPRPRAAPCRSHRADWRQAVEHAGGRRQRCCTRPRGGSTRPRPPPCQKTPPQLQPPMERRENRSKLPRQAVAAMVAAEATAHQPPPIRRRRRAGREGGERTLRSGGSCGRWAARRLSSALCHPPTRWVSGGPGAQSR